MSMIPPMVSAMRRAAADAVQQSDHRCKLDHRRLHGASQGTRRGRRRQRSRGRGAPRAQRGRDRFPLRGAAPALATWLRPGGRRQPRRRWVMAKLVKQVREVAALLREAVDQLPDRTDRWLLRQHDPVDMGDGKTTFCLRCKKRWPCAEYVRLDKQSRPAQTSGSRAVASRATSDGRSPVLVRPQE